MIKEDGKEKYDSAKGDAVNDRLVAVVDEAMAYLVLKNNISVLKAV